MAGRVDQHVRLDTWEVGRVQDSDRGRRGHGVKLAGDQARGFPAGRVCVLGDHDLGRGIESGPLPNVRVRELAGARACNRDARCSGQTAGGVGRLRAFGHHHQAGGGIRIDGGGCFRAARVGEVDQSAGFDGARSPFPATLPGLPAAGGVVLDLLPVPIRAAPCPVPITGIVVRQSRGPDSARTEGVDYGPLGASGEAVKHGPAVLPVRHVKGGRTVLMGRTLHHVTLAAAAGAGEGGEQLVRSFGISLGIHSDGPPGPLPAGASDQARPVLCTASDSGSAEGSETGGVQCCVPILPRSTRWAPLVNLVARIHCTAQSGVLAHESGYFRILRVCA